MSQSDRSGKIAMRIHIITLFPEYFTGPLECGLMRRAQEAGLIRFFFHNPRGAAEDKRGTVDDRPYGGGPGMVMLAGPVCTLLRELGFKPRGETQPGRLILLSPGGKPFTQQLARELARVALVEEPLCAHGRPDNEEPMLTLICARYEGLDARIEELFPVDSLSVGDFVLNGGEAGAVCLIEAVARLLPGFMGHEESGSEESFSAGLLEYPHYTRPEHFEGLPVPEPLLSGDHGRIARWRRQASLARTLCFRPELLADAPLSGEDREFLRQLRIERPGRNLYCALVHHPVLDKAQNSVAVSLTNLDIHDIARSSCAYGLGAYYVLTPLADQRRLLQSILDHWTKGPGKDGNPSRGEALKMVRAGACVEEAIADIEASSGQKPLVLGTTARGSMGGLPCVPFARIGEILRSRPVLLLLGTGHGLAPQVHSLCEGVAPPLRWLGGYNHLSVRSALAVLLDRILGDWR